MKESWTYKKLGEVCETSSGGTPSKSHIEYYEGGTIPWLRSGEVAQGMIYNSELFITESGLKNSSAKLFPVDTVVIAMYGATVGQVGVLKRDMTTNQAICGILPNKIINPCFLMYTLKAQKAIFIKDAVGGAQPNISQNIIKNTSIPIPPITEQQQIVSELDLLSDVIEMQKVQIEELDKLAQSTFYDMFGDPNMNTRHFELKTLNKVCLLKAGKAIKAEELSESSEGLYPCFGGNGVRGYINRYSYEGTYPIIGRQGALCGNVNLASGRFYATEHAVVVSPLIDMNPLWLYYVLLCMRLGQYAHGVAQPGLSVKDLNPLSLMLPPLDLQQEFASKIEAIEQMKAKVRQSLKETEELFNSRMDYYFN